jgi:hypothetical protein
MELTVIQTGFNTYFKECFGKLKTLTFEALLKFMEHIKNSNPNIVFQITLKISEINILITDNFEFFRDIEILFPKISKDDTLRLTLGAVVFDSEVEIPTLNGFPMILNLNNTIVSAFESNFVAKNFAKLKTRELRMNIENKISFGLNLIVGNYKPGFEYYLRLSSNPVIDAMIAAKDGILKAKINLPLEKLTLFELTQNTRLIGSNGQLLESDKYTDNSLISDEKTRCLMIYGM